MENQDHQCQRCGMIMVLKGTEGSTAEYHCKACGNKKLVPISIEENFSFLSKRNMLLSRVRKGIIDWEITQWDALRNEIMDFTAANSAARNDIYFQMSIIACLTEGFHNLDNVKYKECKRIFKITEKVYKRYSKYPSTMPPEMINGTPSEYEEYRDMYKKCKFEYQNRKLIMKLLFKVAKVFVPLPKI